MSTGQRCDLCGQPADVLAADWSEAARSPFAVADRWVCFGCRPDRFRFLVGVEGLGVDVEALGDDVMLDELVGWWLR
jgi:hypothetical protein